MTTARLFGTVLALGLGLTLPASGSLASTEGSAAEARGSALAETHCARCHAITPEGHSPEARAPAFRTLGERYPLHYLEEAMAEGLVVGHSDPPMPAFVFSPGEIADLLSYLESLQPPRQP